MEYKFTTKHNIGQRVYLNVAGSDQYLITNIYLNLATKEITYELMNHTGYKDMYTAIELSSEKLIEV